MRRLNKTIKQFFLGIAAVCFWLLVWHFLAEKIDSSIFLPTPKETMRALFALSKGEEFWQTILNSFTRIVKGFLLAVVCGVVLAVISAFCRMVKLLLEPLMKLIKAVPVASFIILALLWVDSENLSVLIAFVMVLPVIYINIVQSFEQVDKNMLEMAKVFRIPMRRKIRFIYAPSLLPSFIAACKIGLGFCFKSGIAAEVIGLPAKSIGGELYKSKLYLMTDELFAWTIIIILMSVFFEGICIVILNRLTVITKKIGKISDTMVRANSGERDKKSTIKIGTDAEGAAWHKVQKQKNVRTEESRAGLVKDMSFEVVLQNVNKSFGRQRVLKNVSLTFNSKKTVCIMGASGTGKTTLLRILSGLVKPDSGQVIIPKEKRIAMVFQEDRLLEEADVYTNFYCTLGEDFDREKTDEHLKITGLEGVGKKPVKELSGGMKRRVAVIRAVLSRPDILILDEAFKGLDNENRDICIRYIQKYCKGKMIILVSHDREEGEKMGAEIIFLEA